MSKTLNLVKITGNTYPVKEALKALGARWNGDDKCWMVAPEKSEQAKTIVAGAGPKKAFGGYVRRSTGYGRRCYCEECGEPYKRGNRCWETGGTCVPGRE